MKPDTTLTILSVLAVVLMAVHLSQDIVFGYDPSGPSNLTGVAILAVWLYAALALSGRRSGYMILVIGSFFAAMMPVIHLSGRGIRAEVLTSAGGPFFLGTMFALGVSGAVALVLSLQGLSRLEGSGWRALLWTVITIVAGAAFFGSLIYFR